MAYEYRSIRRQKVRYNSDNADNLLIAPLVVDGAKVALVGSGDGADTATISVYAPGSTTALVDEDDMDITDGDSYATYALDTTTVASWPIGAGYRADVTITDTSTTLVHKLAIVFDIAPYLLGLWVTRDQLVDIDSEVNAMEWAGDETLAGKICAARDELQIRLESLATESGAALETMVLDPAKISVVMAYLVLAGLFGALGNEAKYARYEERWRELWKLWCGQIRLDTGHTGSEDDQPTVLHRARFVL